MSQLIAKRIPAGTYAGRVAVITRERGLDRWILTVWLDGGMLGHYILKLPQVEKDLKTSKEALRWLVNTLPTMWAPFVVRYSEGGCESLACDLPEGWPERLNRVQTEDGWVLSESGLREFLAELVAGSTVWATVNDEGAITSLDPRDGGDEQLEDDGFDDEEEGSRHEWP